MSIENMHYDFKQKLNKVNSNLSRGLLIPEIDRKLNEALNLYVLLVARPRLRNQLGFETSLRTTDDMKALVVSAYDCSISALSQGYTVAQYPPDYLYYLSTDKVLAVGNNGQCDAAEMRIEVIKHADRNEDVGNMFYKSNFDWRLCNVSFTRSGIRIYENDFVVTNFKLNYLKVHAYIHNAQDFQSGTYTLPDGTNLTGKNNPELPEITHAEIVDLAVLITTGELILPFAYQFSQNKLKIEQLN